LTQCHIPKELNPLLLQKHGTLTATDYSTALPYNLPEELRNTTINVRKVILSFEIQSSCSVLYNKMCIKPLQLPPHKILIYY